MKHQSQNVLNVEETVIQGYSLHCPAIPQHLSMIDFSNHHTPLVTFLDSSFILSNCSFEFYFQIPKIAAFSRMKHQDVVF